MFNLKNKFVFYLTALFLICSLIFLLRENIFLEVGDFLVFTEQPEKANIIVVLRGGIFDRTMQAAELYRQGYGEKILVPAALGDNMTDSFRELNVAVPTTQERIKSIFVQLGVPEKNIILSTLSPGGGTIGEAYRVKKDLKRLNSKKSIVVTSWYHSNRVHNVYTEVFSETNIKLFTVASGYGESNKSNWWHYRHMAKRVLTELPRSIMSGLSPLFDFSFHDDPGTKNE